jgi:urease accessory protein
LVAVTAMREFHAGLPDFPACPQNSWQAELDLHFDTVGGRTRLAQRRHKGPLMVQRPFHPEADGTCHVYVLHPPGGVAGGDRLTMDFRIGSGARAVLTTPAATKFYRSGGLPSRQTSSIAVAADGVCEYLPQETIVFDDAQAELETSITLEPGASYVGWDIVCLGRPASGDGFRSGSVTQRVTLLRDGRPLWTERAHLTGDSPALAAPHGLAGQTVFATMIYAGGRSEPSADLVRRAVGDRGAGQFSVSELEHVVVCRYLGGRATECKTLFALAWDALRQARQGKPAMAPRVWST